MKNIKNIFKKSIKYIATKRFLSTVIIILLLFPIGTILTKKYLNNKEINTEKLEDQSINTKKNDKDTATGKINTDATIDKTVSKHTVSDGFSTLPDDYSHSSNDNIANNVSNNISHSIDKSSITGIDLEILEGYEFNPKKDLKLQATDTDGSNISDRIIIEKNTVNNTIPGIYSVKASVKLSNGSIKQKEFNVTVKKTRLDVSLKSFKSVNKTAKKDEQIVFDLDLSISKNHVTPTVVMINGKEYPLYKGNDNIFYNLTKNKNYKVIINAGDISGVKEYNLEYVKTSDGSWISLGSNIARVEVLKQEAIVKNFSYKEYSLHERFESKFTIEDTENTASNIRLELYKDNKLFQIKNLDKSSDYNVSMKVNSNGKYELKIIGDISLNQDVTDNNTIFNKEIFKTYVNISNIDQTSIVGENIEVIQGEKLNLIKDLSLKATDFDGEDITDKIVIENNNVDTNIVGKHTVSAYVINKRNQKYSIKIDVNVKPIAKVLEFNPVKDEIKLDENLYFEIKLQMEKTDVDAVKAIINGKEVNLVHKGTKNILGKTKTYLAELSETLSEGNKRYYLSKVIMKDGKEIFIKEEANVSIVNSYSTDYEDSEPSLARILFKSNQDTNIKSEYSKSSASNIVTGNDTHTLIHNVTVNGTVSKSDGGAPSGKIEVELPTAMAFIVDEKGRFISSSYTVSNKSSVPIGISVSQFISPNINGAITIKPIGEDIDNLDRSNLHLALVGNNGYVDLSNVNTTSNEILRVEPSSSNILQLRGESGKNAGSNVDTNGAREEFTLVFKIKKTN